MSIHKTWRGVSGDRHRALSLALAVALAAGSALLACGDEVTAPGGPGPGPGPVVQSVLVTSPIGGHLAAGRSAQLSAVAKDATGGNVSASFTWTSTNIDVATVSASGLVTGIAAGTTAITATAAQVEGRLPMEVVDVDLDRLAALLGDPFVDQCVDHLTPEVGTNLQAKLTECSGYVTGGHLEALETCLAEASSQTAGAPDSTDRFLMTLLGLVIDHAAHQLDL